MKQFVFFLALVFCAAFFGHAQSTADHHSILFKSHHLPEPGLQASLVTMKAEPAAVAMLDLNLRERASSSRRYESAKHKQKVGIVLTAIGGTFLVSGVTLLAVGGHGLHNDILYGDSESGLFGSSTLSHTVEIAFGTIFSLAGTGMTIPGAILTAKGTHDMKKFKASQSVN